MNAWTDEDLTASMVNSKRLVKAAYELNVALDAARTAKTAISPEAVLAVIYQMAAIIEQIQ
jgi:hypothetical protein